MGADAGPAAEPAERIGAPRPSRPHMPDYGVPTDLAGLLSWSHVAQRMAEALHYWICTVSPDHRPHATPVDGLWLDDRLYFGGSSQTRRQRNLLDNSAVCVHLQSGADVVILHGAAHELRAPDRSLTTRLAAASAKKYGYAPEPEAYEAGGVYVVRPRLVFAWTRFPNDATRWHFDDEG